MYIIQIDVVYQNILYSTYMYTDIQGCRYMYQGSYSIFLLGRGSDQSKGHQLLGFIVIR